MSRLGRVGLITWLGIQLLLVNPASQHDYQTSRALLENLAEGAGDGEFGVRGGTSTALVGCWVRAVPKINSDSGDSGDK
jgi:hypothetical protein